MKFTYDPKTDTVTMPAKWWRAIAHTHERRNGGVNDTETRYIVPKGPLERDLSDVFLARVLPLEEVEELLALFDDPKRGAAEQSSNTREDGNG